MIVRNNLQPKLDKEESTQTGLKNIADRYKLLGYSDFKVEKTAEEFSVMLPIIRVE